MMPNRESALQNFVPAADAPDSRGQGPRSALDALMAMMAACAPDTYAHARRVARYSTAIARTLPLPEPLIEQVEQGALLHDIGKLAIPDPDVESDDALGELQASLRRQHVRIAFDILSVVPHLRPAAGIVIAMHERWDGLGYPAGFQRMQIPIGARIVAVADAYDVLSATPAWSNRRLSRDEANAELVRAAGTYFDPDVVRAWLRASERLECC